MNTEELIQEYKDTGDISLRNKIIEDNIGLIKNYALLCNKTQTVGWEDYMQEGVFGMARAIEKFSPGKGCKFSTYAVHWIKAAIKRCQARNVGPFNYAAKTANMPLFYSNRQCDTHSEAVAWAKEKDVKIERILAWLTYSNIEALDIPVTDDELQKQILIDDINPATIAELMQ